MLEFFKNLFASEFMPHGHCYLWKPEILWMHVISDAIITLSYYSIPFALIYLVKKRSDLAFSRIFLLFGGFILLCGTTHLLEIWAVWNGTYRLTGVVKMITAVFSIFTATLLWPTIPKILSLPSTEQLKNVNQQLANEIEERKEIEVELKEHRNNLEELVEERTKELKLINTRLREEIATREKAEKEIKRSELRYHELFDKYHDLYEHAPDMYATVDVQTTLISECNQTLADELGYNKSEIIGRSIFDLYTEDSREKAKDVFASFAELGRVKNAELKIRRKDGSVIDVILNVSAVRDEKGQIVARRSSWRDVTALNAAKQAAQDSAAQIRAIVETAVDAIITMNKKGIVESFNPAAERIFGYRAEEVIGKNINMLMPHPYSQEHDQYLKRYLNTREKNIIGVGREVEGKHKNGRVFPIDLSVSEFTLQNQKRYTGIIRDITERKRLEDIKSEFVSIVSHELRTPLTSINGSLGLIMANTAEELSEITLNMVTIARRNCGRLVRLINDLLDLQQMEAGNFKVKLESVELVDLLKRVKETNTGFAREHGVKLEFNSDVDTLWLEADPDRLDQVVTNLLSNAAKFSPADSVVTINLSSSQNTACVSIIDQGDGIPEDQRDTIFQKFTQVDSVLNRKKEGTGLGLSISKQIIELHHGHIGFESQPGKGTRFYFELPLASTLKDAVHPY